jgi:hypothetical protein
LLKKSVLLFLPVSEPQLPYMDVDAAVLPHFVLIADTPVLFLGDISDLVPNPPSFP